MRPERDACVWPAADDEVAQILARLEVYGFRDEYGHPLALCQEFGRLLELARRGAALESA